jgi:hypothetical protein
MLDVKYKRHWFFILKQNAGITLRYYYLLSG